MFPRGFPLVFARALPLGLALALASGWLSARPVLAASAPAPSDIDGIPVVATEAYPSQSRSELFIGTGIYPFDSYFNSFAIDLAYDYRLSRTFTWEVLRLDELYSVNKDLAPNLADQFGLNPPSIERPSYLISTDAIFTTSFGKFVAIDEGIRYFKAGIEVGGGVLGTTTTDVNASGRTLPTANAGLRFDIYISRVFSWKIEVRDSIAVTSGFENFVMFHLGGGISL